MTVNRSLAMMAFTLVSMLAAPLSAQIDVYPSEVDYYVGDLVRGPGGVPWFVGSTGDGIAIYAIENGNTVLKIAGGSRLASSPDESLWYVDEHSCVVHRLADGSTESHCGLAARGIAVSSTGQGAFAYQDGAARINADGSVRSFALSPGGYGGEVEWASDGMLWYGDERGQLFRIDAAGKTHSFDLPTGFRFALPSAYHGHYSAPSNDGSVWIRAHGDNGDGIAHISASGQLLGVLDSNYDVNFMVSDLRPAPDGGALVASYAHLYWITQYGTVLTGPQRPSPKLLWEAVTIFDDSIWSAQCADFSLLFPSFPPGTIGPAIVRVDPSTFIAPLRQRRVE